ncbi:DUF3817 domain-containing protein [Paenarthrobacter sp. DKR-5]|uniref:DUF3817 domain-containing protein n=1 Tax=Paenarthrobacter sp. DKR-5 TaxID=2835535 RepID=UPI001BDCF147|nr:DUF3817 domain-containing protein [Paenarthrobacter sp. DKR-5]MBT1001008.1 DUF3817 domain-containing protein [Paenarthrobacter sp. DKR-5]
MTERTPAAPGTAGKKTGQKKRRFGGTEAQIRSALGFYKVMAYATGIMLLLLCVEMVLRYGAGLSLVAGGTDAAGNAHGFGFVASDPTLAVTGGINLSLAVLIVHGWMYVVYLVSDFRLWSLMRWPFTKFILIALGGVVPFLSFFVEKRFHREVEAELASHPQASKRY